MGIADIIDENTYVLDIELVTGEKIPGRFTREQLRERFRFKRNTIMRAHVLERGDVRVAFRKMDDTAGQVSQRLAPEYQGRAMLVPVWFQQKNDKGDWGERQEEGLFTNEFAELMRRAFPGVLQFKPADAVLDALRAAGKWPEEKN